MLAVKVTCNTGKTWTTGINTDIAGATEYFMGQTVTDESDNGTETHHTVIAVELASTFCI